MSDSKKPSGPLVGVKVVELSGIGPAPLCCALLSDMGAEVIRIDRNTDPGLGIGRPNQTDVTRRGRASVSVDLKNPDGVEAVMRLIEQAEAVIDPFRPGVTEKLGLGPEDCFKRNKKVIYGRMTGWGQEGALAHAAGQALSSATDIQADRDTGRPKMFRIIIADKVTSLTAAQAISSALFARERTGKGEHIQVSMLDAMVSFFWPEGMSGITFVGDEIDVTKYQGTMDLIYATANGYITAGAVSDPEWRGMCTALNKPEWIEDERFATTAMRFKNAELRKQMTAAEIQKWDRDKILARLDEEGVPSAPLLSRLDLLDDEQIAINGTIQIYDWDGHGQIRQAKPAANFSQFPSTIDSAAPLLGEHTAAVFRQLGYDDGAIAGIKIV